MKQIDFDQVQKVCLSFALEIRNKRDLIIQTLGGYESPEVANDEIDRCLDLMENISENAEYFQYQVGEVTAFLPRNQPLYALCCFVLIPSFLGSRVHFRVPHTMKGFFNDLLVILNVLSVFPNVIVSTKERRDFLKERTALFTNKDKTKTWPVSEVVIFTGTPLHAEKLRTLFDKRTLFITNGSGHNPIVIASDANLSLAIEAIMAVCFYNEGQDCAAPSSILVHESRLEEVKLLIESKLESRRTWPINDQKDISRIASLIVENAKWLYGKKSGKLDVGACLVEPTIIVKPLVEGGSYAETFAPIVVLQSFKLDSELDLYFNNPRYSRNAMYVSVYGACEYVKQLTELKVNGQKIHDDSTILYNTHLHAKGVERGVKPYGGYGYGASNLSVDGTIICKPTLPQRDIYEQVVQPRIEQNRGATEGMVEMVYKDIEKLTKLFLVEGMTQKQSFEGETYIDRESVGQGTARYVKLPSDKMYNLLSVPNIEYIVSMSPLDADNVKDLRILLEKESEFGEEFEEQVYVISKRNGQKKFFEHVYNLLFGKSAGPHLVSFLKSVEINRVCDLLNV